MKPKASKETPAPTRQSDKYWVPIVAKTLDLLDCFASESESLTLEQIVQRTKLPHTTAYRILHTLVLRDYIQQTGRQYRLKRARKKIKLGFANLSKHISLAVEIQSSLEQAAIAAGVQLQIWDNDRNAEKAIRNAEQMVESKVDLAIEFQLYEHVAPVIADIFATAGIPLISLVNPHHGTLYFGVDNYRAGFLAGLALASYAAEHWNAHPDSVLLLESPAAGRTVQSRLIGVLRGLEERLGTLDEKRVHHLDSGGDKNTAQLAVKNFIRQHRGRRVLIAGINDETAIGAVQAARNISAPRDIAIVGHGGSPEMLSMISEPDSPCIGTVSFRAESYGPDLMNFALPIIQGRSTTPKYYVSCEFVSKRT